MTDYHRSRLRDVMKLAWAFYRTPNFDGSPKEFAYSLRAAWRMIKSNEECAKRWRGTQVRFSTDLTASRKGSKSGGRSSASYISARLWR